jgi:hypothetical protein
VLTTKGGTASASELTIDALRPYIDVFTIGETTYGKFVSITLYDSPNDDYISYNNRINHITGLCSQLSLHIRTPEMINILLIVPDSHLTILWMQAHILEE